MTTSLPFVTRRDMKVGDCLVVPVKKSATETLRALRSVLSKENEAKIKLPDGKFVGIVMFENETLNSIDFCIRITQKEMKP